MPEISRFFGIVIRMFVEAGAPHHRPHLHAYYQGYVAVFAVDRIASVELDKATRTLVWPTGADFDPYTLHDWPRFAAELAERARSWAGVAC